MIAKDQVIALLEIHGMSIHSSDNEIRTVLLSAQYENDEIETAIISLRTDPETADANDIKRQGLHKIFFTDQGLRPHEVSALLGIDIEVNQITAKNIELNQRGSFYLNLIIFGLAIFFAIGALAYGMYISGLGPFTNTVTVFAD